MGEDEGLEGGESGGMQRQVRGRGRGTENKMSRRERDTEREVVWVGYGVLIRPLV